MPRFNPDKIAKLISEMRKAINHLRSFTTLDKESFIDDPDEIGNEHRTFLDAAYAL